MTVAVRFAVVTLCALLAGSCGPRHSADAGRRASALRGVGPHRRDQGRQPDQPAALRPLPRVHVRGHQVRPARRAAEEPRLRGDGQPRRPAARLGARAERPQRRSRDDVRAGRGRARTRRSRRRSRRMPRRMRCVSIIKARYDGPRGVRQGRIPVRRNVAYHGSFWLKTPDYDGAVTLALGQDQEGGRTYASQVIPKVTADDGWHQYTFTLTPREADPLAKLTILFDGKGRLWLDQVSLLPGDAVDGVRADVLERIKALKPAFVRWPGGNVAQDYHWQWGVGPRDRRPSWINKAWWNEREPGDFGSDEFIAFCRTIGAEPHLVVNVEGAGATPEEAAAWVEYMNGPPDVEVRRDARGERAPRAVQRQDVGAGQRDLGRLGARPFRRRDLRPQLPPVSRRDARRRPVDPVHRRRPRPHRLERAGAGARRPQHRPAVDPPLRRPLGAAGRRACSWRGRCTGRPTTASWAR